MTPHNYDTFFEAAFAVPPFSYQQEAANAQEVPALINVPTGAGKTAAVLGAWLWRRWQNPASVGRRLIYCLPMRTLVEQTANEAKKAVGRLVLAGIIDEKRFGVHVLMGGDASDEWDIHPERECIIVGTQDMLLSRALNRGYAMSPFRWTVQFGLLNSDCLWVFDEVQLMGNALATSTQLDAFRRRFRTFGTCDSVWMSATLDEEWLKTVDFKTHVEQMPDERRLRLSKDDRAAKTLDKRLKARKVVRPTQGEGENSRAPDSLARFVVNKHHQILQAEQKPQAAQTLIVVNRVARAREVFAALRSIYEEKPAGNKREGKRKQNVAPTFETMISEAMKPELRLIHSRYRPAERGRWLTWLTEKPSANGAGRIIVATQVIEAGVDLSSRLLVTDIAPVSSLVQRFGRCNRAGEHEKAEIYWIDRPLASATKAEDDEGIARPYNPEQLETARTWLHELESAAPADLENKTNTESFTPQNVLRERELLNLFDTTPDLTGAHIDVSPYVRGGDERDVMVAWRELKFIKGKLPKKTKRLRREELCPVPIGEFAAFLKEKAMGGKARVACSWNIIERNWLRVDARELRPGMMLLLDVSAGGYDEQEGWNPKLKQPVTSVPVPTEKKPDALLGEAEQAEEGVSDDPLSHPDYIQNLAAHSREVKLTLTKIIDALAGLGLEKWATDLLVAAHHHDWGKAHDEFQKTLHKKLSSKFDDVQLAKSDTHAKHERTGFRHELASALALLATGEASDLAVYLTACHHGKVRLNIRAHPKERPPIEPNRLYALGIHNGEVLPAADLGDGFRKECVTLDLKPMLIGSDEPEGRSWFARMSALVYGEANAEANDATTLGVFRLAFLESLITAADRRASRNPDPESILRDE